jgi:hypothetical protein
MAPRSSTTRHAARPAGRLRPDRPRGIAKPRGERVDLDAMTARARAGTAGDAPLLRGGFRPPVGTPAPASRRFRGQRSPVAAPRELGAGRPPRAGDPVTAQRSQSRALAALTSLPRWRYAPPMSVIFLGKTSALNTGS